MKMYIWSSSYLENYGKGTIVVVSNDVVSAIRRARQVLEDHLKNKVYNELYLEGNDLDEYVRDKQALIELDVIAAPTVQHSGVLLIPGSN